MWRVLAGAWLVSLVPPCAAQAGQLLDAKVRDLLHEELSGEIAKEHVIGITRFHRIQGSRGYHAAAEWVLERLREYGFDEEHAWIESYPSDGKIHYQTWQSPSGWDIDSAELRMVEPSDERIVGFPESPMSVVTYSNAGDVTAELVWVGAGESESDYAGKDVKGKFVLATGYGGNVHRLAVLGHGAAAVVCYLADERAADHPDMLQYTGMWPRPEELARTTFGFNLTNRQGERLRERLAAGEKVVLHGKVEGQGLEPFVMDVVVAKIDGSERPEEELLFTSHLDHPKESANDNASGSGANLDIARALRRLIDGKRLAAPKRTLRFLWVPEWFGTMAYLDGHAEVLGNTWNRGGQVLANMNLDMVGENTELLHSRLVVTQNPFSVPSCVDDLVEDVLATVDASDVHTERGSRSAFHYRHAPFSGGSDHMMFLDRGIASVMLSHDPDYTHHTSEDTPDKVDPTELERCELLAAGTLWHLANLDEAQASALAWRAATGAQGRLASLAERARGWVRAAPPEKRGTLASEADSALAAGAQRETLVLRSVLDHYDRNDAHASPALAKLVDAQCALLSEQAAGLRRTLAAELGQPAAASTAPDGRRVVRATRGPLSFGIQERRLSPERAAWYGESTSPFRAGERRYELVNLANTGEPLSAIRTQYEAEFEPVDARDVARFFEDLQELGLVQLREGE